MIKPAILCDVDLTFLDSGTPWLKWLIDVFGVEPDFSIEAPDGLIHYNLGKYFPEPSEYQPDKFDFWEDHCLYDKLNPLPGAVEALRTLKGQGHPIRFVSHCKKGHFSSKVRMLKRHTSDFLDLEKGSTGDGFYAAKIKSGVKGGVIIDDRNEILNQFAGDPSVIKIKFKTPYTQSEAPACVYDFESDDWSEIQKFISDIFQ